MGEGGTAGGGGSGGGTVGGGGGGSGGGGSSGKISRVTKGDKGRTMMHASVANEVIDATNDNSAAINAIKNAKVSPPEAGSFMFSESNAVLKLSGVGGKPGVISGAVNGVPSTATIPFIVEWAAI